MARGTAFEAHLAKTEYSGMINTQDGFEAIDFVSKSLVQGGKRNAISLKTLDRATPDANLKAIEKHINDLKKSMEKFKGQYGTDKTFPAPVGTVNKVILEVRMPPGRTLRSSQLADMKKDALKIGIILDVKTLQ